MDQITKENPAGYGANLNTLDANKYNKKRKKKQSKSDFVIEVTVHPSDPESSPIVFVLDGKPAKSLWYLYQYQAGLTRAEALDNHFILSLTQHVHFFRHSLKLDIETERVDETHYARYHLLTPLNTRILSQGGL